MPDLWMDVDTALSEVPINLLPLIDDTDFKTREESVTYNQAGLDLVWNFVTTAGAMTQTAVTPTDTAGDYDWVNQGNGLYTIEIPASGGVSINNDTEGFGWFTGVATGVLPWRGPVIGFRAAGLNNALIDDAYSATRGLAGTALPNAAADAEGGLPISDAGGLDLDALNGRIIGTIAAGTHNAQSGDAFARLGLPAGASVSADVAVVDANVDTLITRITSTLFSGITSLAEWLGLLAGKQLGDATALAEIRATGAGAGTYDPTMESQEAIRDRGDAAWVSAVPPTAAAIADAVLDEAMADHVAAGSLGKAVADTLADTNEVQGDLANGGRLDLIIDTIAADVAGLDGAAMRGTDSAALASVCTEARLTELDAANLPTDVGAAALRTALGLAAANLDTQLAALPTAAENATEVLDQAAGVQTSWTVRQTLRIILAAVAGKLSGAATATNTIRDPGDTIDRIVATVDADGNRTAVTYDKT